MDSVEDFAGAKATVTSSSIVLENSVVRRVLEKDADVWRTKSFGRAEGSDEMPVWSDEFLVVLMDGTRLRLEDVKAQAEPVTRSSREGAVVEIIYVPRGGPVPGAPLSILTRYALGGGPYLRKTLTLAMGEGGAVDRLEVERFKTQLPCDLGGIGQPIFIGDSWFVGLEYPGSHAERSSGLVALAHYPGLARKSAGKDGEWTIRSKTAVAGVGLKGDPLELAFSDYLDTVRQPCPRHVVANKWPLKVKSGKEFIDYFDGFDGNLASYGVKIDSVQPDFIGFDPESVSLPNKSIFPQGYRPLSQELESRGSSLSLWLSLNGTGNDAEWMTGQGYQRANGPYHDIGGYYCASAPRFNRAMRQTLEKTISDGNISYFKHDFVQAICSAEGHGHLPTVRHGFEANVDAILEFMTYERQLKPDILCAPTSYVWVSPWWLTNANYIFMGGSDTGSVATWPQLSPREREMNYRDDHLFRVYRKWRYPVPLSAMITHAFTRAPSFNEGGDQESLREWSDLAMMVYGRGLRLIDMYIDPSMLSPEFWRALGESTRWWQENLELLGSTSMIGGSPRGGEVYGYAHWKGDRGIICLRNPDIGEQVIRVPFDRSVFYRGEAGKPFRCRVVYPFVEDLPRQFVSGEPMLLGVPGYTVMLIEVQPGEAPLITPAQVAGDIEGTGSVVPEERDWSGAQGYYKDPSLALTAKVTVNVPDEAMDRCDLFLIARCNGPLPELDPITLNGLPAQVRYANGGADAPSGKRYPFETDDANWSLRSIDLRAFRGEKVEMVAPSSRNPVPFALDAWVVADRPVEPPPLPQGSLPPQFWHAFRRQTVRLLSYRLGVTPMHD